MPPVKKLLEKMKQQPNGMRPENLLKKAYVMDVLNRIGEA